MRRRSPSAPTSSRSAEACAAGQFDLLEQTVEKFQRASHALKYAQVPVVAAVQGMALGGGCEFLMHAAQARDRAGKLYRPGRGRRRPDPGRRRLQGVRHPRRPSGPRNRRRRAKSSTSCSRYSRPSPWPRSPRARVEARDSVSPAPPTRSLFNANELLYVALREARAPGRGRLLRRRCSPRGIPVAGRDRHRHLRDDAGQHEGRRHDLRARLPGRQARLPSRCAAATSRPAALVDEEWLLTVERRCFVELLKTPETQARIEHMLETGKPLRN